MALTGRAWSAFRAGFAGMVISSPVNGLRPWRALVFGLMVTRNRAKPGIVKTPTDPFFR